MNKIKVTIWNRKNTKIVSTKIFRKVLPARKYASKKFIKGFPIRLDRIKK